MNLSGATRLAAVIGDPIRHSRSPAIFNAAFAAAGLDWAYLAFEVPAGGAGGALDGMRALGIEGLSVTMPHKSDVAELVDERSPQAERLGAVNCVVRRGGRLIGHNTDGAGFVASLRADAGFDPAGRRVRRARRRRGRPGRGAGPGRGRRVGRRGGEPLARQGGDRGRAGRRRGVDGPDLDLAASLAAADLVVNATSLGMDASSTPVGAEALAALPDVRAGRRPRRTNRP